MKAFVATLTMFVLGLGMTWAVWVTKTAHRHDVAIERRAVWEAGWEGYPRTARALESTIEKAVRDGIQRSIEEHTREIADTKGRVERLERRMDAYGPAPNAGRR